MQHDAILACLDAALWQSAVVFESESTVIDDQWVMMISPDAPNLHLNGVLRCELEESEANERIQKTIAFFKERALPFHWVVSPLSRPADLAARLGAAGFERGETTMGMYAHPDRFGFGIAEGVTLEALSEQNLEDYIETQMKGWSIPQNGYEKTRQLATKRLSQKGRFKVYLARFQDQPAGSAAMHIHNKFVHFVGAAVDPAYRQRGVFRSLLAHRMAEARRLRKKLVTVHALSLSSAPTLSRMGFIKVCEFNYFLWRL